MEVRQRGLIAGVLTAALLVAPFNSRSKTCRWRQKPRYEPSAAPAQSYQQPRQAAPVQQPATAGAPAKSGSNAAVWLRPVWPVLLLAQSLQTQWPMTRTLRLLLKRKLSKQEEKGRYSRAGSAILLAAAVAFFIFRKMGAKKKLANNPYAPNNGANNAPFGQQNAAPRPASGDNTNIFGGAVGGNTAASMRHLALRQQAPHIPTAAINCRTVQNLQHFSCSASTLQPHSVRELGKQCCRNSALFNA